MGYRIWHAAFFALADGHPRDRRAAARGLDPPSGPRGRRCRPRRPLPHGMGRRRPRGAGFMPRSGAPRATRRGVADAARSGRGVCSPCSAAGSASSLAAAGPRAVSRRRARPLLAASGGDAALPRALLGHPGLAARPRGAGVFPRHVGRRFLSRRDVRAGERRAAAACRGTRRNRRGARRGGARRRRRRRRALERGAGGLAPRPRRGSRAGTGRPAAALGAFGFLGLVLCYRRVFHIGDSAYTGRRFSSRSSPPRACSACACSGSLRGPRASGSARRLRRAPRLRDGGRLRRPVRAVRDVGGVPDRRDARLPDGSRGGGARDRRARADDSIRDATRVRSRRLSGRRAPELSLGAAEPDSPHALSAGVFDRRQRGRGAARARGASAGRGRALAPAPPEYNRALFGYDYGKKIRAWIGRNYAISGYRAPGAPERTNPRFEWGPRRPGIAS